MQLGSWIIIGLLAIVCKSGYQSWQKELGKEYDALELTQVAHLVCVPIFGLFVAFKSPELKLNYITVGFPVIGGACLAVGLWMFNKSLETTDLSISSPLQQTIPVFVVLIEPFIIDSINLDYNLLVIALTTVLGAYVVSLNKTDSILSPVYSLSRKGPLLAVGTAILFAVASVITSLTTQSVSVLWFLFIEVISASVIITLIRWGWPSANRNVVAYSILYSFNLGLSILTISVATASEATILFRLSLIINVLVGYKVYDEDDILIRIIGSVIIIIGICLTILIV